MTARVTISDEFSKIAGNLERIQNAVLNLRFASRNFRQPYLHHQ